MIRFESLSHTVMSDSWRPQDCSPPGSSVHGILQAKYWSGFPFPSPGDLADPGIEPALQTDSLPSEPPGAPTGMDGKTSLGMDL